MDVILNEFRALGSAILCLLAITLGVMLSLFVALKRELTKIVKPDSSKVNNQKS